MATPPLHNVVVAGGFGGVGFFITKALLDAKVFKVKVIGRGGGETKPNQDLLSAGATFAAVDYDSVDSLAAALAGADAVVSAVNAAAAYQPQLNLLEAAKKAGVKRFLPSEYGGIYLFKTPEAPFVASKIPVAHQVLTSGLEYTFLSTGPFTDTAFNAFMGMDIFSPSDKVEWTVGGDGHAKIAFTTRADVGRFVAQVLLHPDLSRNKYLAVHGDVATPHEAAAVFEQVSGKKVTIKTRTLADLRAAIKAKPGPTAFDNIQEQLLLTLGNGDGAHNHDDSVLFPDIKPTTLKAYFESVLAAPATVTNGNHQ